MPHPGENLLVHRTMVGDIRVIAVGDGYLEIDPKMASSGGSRGSSRPAGRSLLFWAGAFGIVLNYRRVKRKALRRGPVWSPYPWVC
jgi:hypothetical protein